MPKRKKSRRRTKANITETPLPQDTLDTIKGCAGDALIVLALRRTAGPRKVLAGVDAFACRWQAKDRPAKNVVKDGEEARLIMGSLWGEQLVKKFGWHWAQVTFHDHDDSIAFGVFSPDRSLAIYPLDFMLGCLRNKYVDVTVLLSFNMLLAGKIPEMKAKSYTNVMEGVHRIVPSNLRQFGIED